MREEGRKRPSGQRAAAPNPELSMRRAIGKSSQQPCHTPTTTPPSRKPPTSPTASPSPILRPSRSAQARSSTWQNASKANPDLALSREVDALPMGAIMPVGGKGPQGNLGREAHPLHDSRERAVGAFRLAEASRALPLQLTTRLPRPERSGTSSNALRIDLLESFLRTAQRSRSRQRQRRRSGTSALAKRQGQHGNGHSNTLPATKEATTRRESE